MGQFFQALWRVTAAGAQVINSRVTPQVARIVRRVSRQISNAVQWMLIWPIFMFAFAMLPPPWGGLLVLAATLLSLVPLAWIFTTPSALVSIIAVRTIPTTTSYIGEFVELARKALNAIRIIVGIEVLIGLYLAWVPVANDRILALRLILVVAAAVCFIGISNKIFKSLVIIAIGITIVFFLGGRDAAQKRILANTTQQQTAAVSENKIVCPNAWEQELKHVNDHRGEDPDYFDVVLSGDDCFGERIHPPNGDVWETWDKEFVSDEPDPHVSIWYTGHDPVGPFGPGNLPEFENRPREWRLKGKGTLRYFKTSGRSSQAPPAKSEAIPEPPQVATTEVAPPHTLNRVYSVREDGVVAPREITSKHIDPKQTNESLKAKFAGSVTISFVVGEDGIPRDIDILQNPGFGLDEEIFKAASQWRFEPGTKDGAPVPVRATATITFGII